METPNAVNVGFFSWPAAGQITSPFSMRKNPLGVGYDFHAGIDIAAEAGAPIRAVAKGRVIAAGQEGGYGNAVAVDQGNGVTSRHAHCSQLLTVVGPLVNAGDEIATVGSSGRSTGPHLHFEVRENGKAVDPQLFLNPG
ncbi:MAG: hypothetical protein DLM50_06155 [Candidatus Meridianibacter frigidus]|nr:MAG: hypothetical protein DLM50_06155 [Candidatus Eremiobacteraeota bacterium]